MIVLSPRESCSACGACVYVCRQQCITMQSNGLGQFFPVIDTDRCVECHVCERACPVLHIPVSAIPQKAYAAWSLDEEQRHSSASGGVAYELYKYALVHGHKVVGASQNDDLTVSLKIALTMEEIIPFKNSKYVFSDCGELYPQLQRLLRDGEKIMIVGMPCQIAAMRNLYKKYEAQLIFVEILCHGMVPFSYLRQHVDTIESSKNIKATSMNFRAPEYHTHTYTFTLYGRDGKCFYAANKHEGDSYQIGFSTAATYMESCYHCHFAKRERVGDIVLCDYWGLGKKIPFHHDTKEVSCIISVTEKGQQFLDKVFSTDVLYVEERPMEEAVEGNPRLRIPNIKTKTRLSFERNIRLTNGNFEQAMEPLVRACMKTQNRSALYYYWQGVKYRIRKLIKHFSK